MPIEAGTRVRAGDDDSVGDSWVAAGAVLELGRLASTTGGGGGASGGGGQGARLIMPTSKSRRAANAAAARALRDEALVHMDAGRCDGAERCLNQALRICEPGAAATQSKAQRLLLAELLGGLFLLCRLQGRLDEAEAACGVGNHTHASVGAPSWDARRPAFPTISRLLVPKSSPNVRG